MLSIATISSSIAMHNLCALFRVRTLLFLAIFLLASVYFFWLWLPYEEGARWAILIAGSRGFADYRHQAHVCHAYHVLRRSGVADENIIVFMYDDINHQDGTDVCKGVPKDYVGEEVNRDNVLAVLLGDKLAVRSGSGKVVGAGQNDRIFVFFSGRVSHHGNQQLLSMPTGPSLTSSGLVDVLKMKMKHATGIYKSLVFYLEACRCGSILDEACRDGSIFEGALPRGGGSIFEGALPRGLNSTTASNAEDSNCQGFFHGFFHGAPPPEYTLSLGDMYCVAGMEACDMHNLRIETLHQQYELVQPKVTPSPFRRGSYEMQYSDLGLSKKKVFLYLGTNPAIDYYTSKNLMPAPSAVSQSDASLLHFWVQYFNSLDDDSARKAEARKELMQAMSRSMQIADNIQFIGNFLFGYDTGQEVLSGLAGQPLADGGDCLGTLVTTFEEHCGPLFGLGANHIETLANLCKAGIQQKQMAEASARACRCTPD